ncbi:hypothetical protein K493DRAFT_315829 [Basidiobolus meristosporus CBS 931.73]|uniref:Uncharacterized protein n=1 Tax=Basidiobolus meristosporus CBS 931.73 TaxID=1314790 RepID=A0A1Y1Y7S5_9FUNG|nr:hypothetical protein K493DRAFT_315829 [Basidiobolus meristosporus CBS 931.73]|eukprot:ORX93786.1 hypothetical protein K493DRAFT_315829 [Basidiobolus meristosporus CBS 931.73]
MDEFGSPTWVFQRTQAKTVCSLSSQDIYEPAIMDSSMMLPDSKVCVDHWGRVTM